MKIIIEPIYGEYSGAVVTLEHAPDEIEEGAPTQDKHVFSFDWFGETHGDGNCPNDGLINMLYTILEEGGHLTSRYSAHRVRIHCEQGDKLEGETPCPNRYKDGY